MQNNRSDARRLGEIHYKPDKPCRNGHSAPRMTTNGVCVECQKIHIDKSRKRWREEYNRAKALK